MLHLLFPPACISCGVLLGRGRDRPFARFLCGGCATAAAALPAPLRAVNGIHAVLPYQPPWSTALTRVKFGGQMALSGPLGALIASSPHLRATPSGAAWDGVVAVPLHWRRLCARGFDQALLLALAATRGRDAPPVLRRAMLRTRPTPPQSRLSADKRLSNLRRAFKARRPAALANRRILVLDDVTTTGATLASCAEAVRAAGAKEVGALALLRTLPG